MEIVKSDQHDIKPTIYFLSFPPSKIVYAFEAYFSTRVKLDESTSDVSDVTGLGHSLGPIYCIKNVICKYNYSHIDIYLTQTSRNITGILY